MRNDCQNAFKRLSLCLLKNDCKVVLLICVGFFVLYYEKQKNPSYDLCYRCLQIHESLAPVSLLPVVIPGLHLVAFGVFAVCSDDLVVLGWVSYDNSGNVRDVFFENWSKHLCSLSVSLFTMIRILFYLYRPKIFGISSQSIFHAASFVFSVKELSGQ